MRSTSRLILIGMVDSVRLGDDTNGFIDEAVCNLTFRDAVEELILMVLKHYPNSTYAKCVQ